MARSVSELNILMSLILTRVRVLQGTDNILSDDFNNMNTSPSYNCNQTILYHGFLESKVRVYFSSKDSKDVGYFL